MPVKLCSTKFYVVNLASKIVAIDYCYDRFCDAVDSDSRLQGTEAFMALTGKHIMAHIGKPWIVPATP